jgi:WD40 repeat protein
MILAQSALENNNPGYTRQLLALYEGPSTGNDYRGFEWHYLNQQLKNAIRSRENAPFLIYDIAIRPGSKEFASVNSTRVLEIWNPLTCEVNREVSLQEYGMAPQHNATHPNLDYSDDGQLMVIGSNDGEIRFLDAETLKLKKQFTVGSKDIMDIDFLPGKICIVQNSEGGIFSVQIETGDVTLIQQPTTRRDAYRDGQPVFRARSFACSSDGKYLAFNVSPQDIAVWDIRQGKRKYLIKGAFVPRGGTGSLALSSNGGMLAHGDSRGEISVWRTSTGVSIYRHHDHSDPIRQVIFTPDGRSIVSLSDNTSVTVNQLGAKVPRVFHDHLAYVRCLAVAPNNKFIATADQTGNLKVFSLTESIPHRTHQINGKSAFSFHPLKKSYAIRNSNNDVEIWELDAKQPTQTLSGHENGVCCLAFHPEGKELAAGLDNGTIYTWNLNTSDYRRSWQGHESAVLSLAYSRDGKRLASSAGVLAYKANAATTLESTTSDNQLKIWNTDNGQIVRSLPFTHASHRLSWNDDGTRVVLGTAHQQKASRWLGNQSLVIDVNSGKTLLKLPGESGVYTPDGKHLLYVLGAGEVEEQRLSRKIIIICDALTGKEIRRLTGHIDRILDVIITADSKRVISVDRKAIAVWNINTGMQLMTLPCPEVNQLLGKLATGPDGRSLAYQGYYGTTVWSTGKITEPSQEEESR